MRRPMVRQLLAKRVRGIRTPGDLSCKIRYHRTECLHDGLQAARGACRVALARVGLGQHEEREDLLVERVRGAREAHGVRKFRVGVGGADGAARANHVHLIGVDEQWLKMGADQRFASILTDGVLLN